MYSFILFLCIIILLQYFPYNHCYKILVFSPSISPSHQISCARVADALARNGHDVTLLLEVQFAVPLGRNFSQTAKIVRVPGPFFRFDLGGMDFQQMLAEKAFLPPSVIGAFICYKHFQIAMNEACERFITSQNEMIERLKGEHFDLLIEEQLNFCGAGLGHLLGIPTHILVSSSPIQEHVSSLFGLSFPTSFVPSIVDSDSSDKMSLWKRFDNILRAFVGHVTYTYYGIDALTQIFRKHFGSNFPDLRQIVGESPFLFINVDELIEFPRPVFANMIYIGGLGMETNQTEQKIELKEPFKSEMAKGRDGVIFVSMGSMIRSSDLSEEFRKNLLDTFGQMPNYHFIVRIEKEDTYSPKVAAQYHNVFLTHWAPQTELLGHPRLRLFITHGGYNSLMEAARSGIPLVAMGFFADQFRNARIAERNGWALPFDKRILMEDNKKFRATIEEVLNNPKYTIAAKRIQQLIRTKPFSAEERLIKNIHFLEQNGGKLPELLSESRKMSTIALHNLDLAMIGIGILSLFLMGMYLLIKWIFNKIAKKLKQKTD